VAGPNVSASPQRRGFLPGEVMMLYLGIDLHRKQMTVSLRNESGDVLLRRQVSTRWSKVEEAKWGHSRLFSISLNDPFFHP
jgi:hypothetical protein